MPHSCLGRAVMDDLNVWFQPPEKESLINLVAGGTDFADPLIEQRLRAFPTDDIEVSVHSDKHVVVSNEESRIEITNEICLRAAANKVTNTN
jgi:hypothetical protein